MQVIGICRFSYPAIGGFQVLHDTIEDRIAYLYHPDRLEERFRLFETVALPSLRAQTDSDFTLVIVIGDQFPNQHVKRLETLVADIPQAQIHAEPPGNHRKVMQDLINQARLNPREPCLQFRFDDDDAIAVDFVQKLRSTAEIGLPLLRQSRTVAFDWNRGFNAQFGPQGIEAQEIFRPFFVASLGMLIGGRCWKSIMNYGHEKIPQFMPALTFPDPAMFIRGINTSNDSRQNAMKDPKMLPLAPSDEAHFKDRFGIDADTVRRVFSAR